MDEALSVESLMAGLGRTTDGPESVYRPGTFSAYLDAREGTHWRNVIREEAAKWCAACYDRGQAAWNATARDKCFYEAWLEIVPHDRNLACAGLKKAHTALGKMPARPEQAIAESLAILGIPENLTTEWLYRTLLTLPGWSGHLRYLDREKQLRGTHGTELVQLLAILTNYERLLYGYFTSDRDCMLGWRRILMEKPFAPADEAMPLEMALRLLWQSAYEHRVESQLRHAIQPEAIPVADAARPDVQAAFCIDVRSELFRRNLETALTGIQTIGFAGFFGVPLNHTPFGHHSAEARCPALLAPPLDSGEHAQGRCCQSGSHGSERAWRKFKESAASCFSFVETLGMSYSWKLLGSALGMGKQTSGHPAMPEISTDLDPDTRITLAANIIKGLTLTQCCAPLVLLCGHGSTTRNNPHASGLDCGACGGHPGDVNARIAARLLNDLEVRAGLKKAGLSIPDDTIFIAGLHNTTTDEVTLFDLHALPESHHILLKKLQQGLDQAGMWTAAIRMENLDKAGGNAMSAVRARSRDWSQVRPEWGLAGNAGFIIAPRAWTRNASLNGRAFLHEYDPYADPEGMLLESIMAGPLIVGSWINLQYYASATDNTHFGSGHKAIHNVVGGLGVALGNESDLRPGLPIQSLHNGHRFVHEPSRLHAMVAAGPSVIDAILERQPQLQQLLQNEWLHLYALGSDGERFCRRHPSGNWETRTKETRAAFPGLIPNIEN